MTTNAQANNTNDTGKTVAAEVKKQLPNLVEQNMLEKGFEKFTKPTFLKAIKVAGEGLHHVREEDIIIRQKQQGNAARLYALAKECVKLTMQGDQADLGKAAELMQEACEYAETVFLKEYRKSNPDKLSEDALSKVTMKDASPSWYTLRGDAVRALKTTEIDPTDFKNYSAMNEAFKLWKKKQNTPPEAERGTGGATAAGKAEPKKSVKVSAGVAETAERLGKLSDSSRSIISNLTVAMEQLDDAAQAEAVKILTIALGQVRNLAAKEDKPKAPKIHKPAATPESHSISA